MTKELIKIIKNENIEELNEYLKNNKVNLNFVTSDNETPLILATRLGNNDLVRTLLQQNINVDFQNETLDTALTIASENGDKEIIKLLLLSGADPTLQNEDGKSSLDYIKKYNYKDILTCIDLDLKEKIESFRDKEPSINNKPTI